MRIRTKQGITFFVVLVMTATTLTACGASQKVKVKTTTESSEILQDDPERIFGATYGDLNNPFFVELNDGIEATVEEQGDRLIALDASLDQQKQIEQVKRLIDFGVSAIFLAPVNWKEVKPILDAANEAGVPIFNVDTPAFDEDLVASIIASDNYDAGVQIANDMMKKLDSAKIAIIERPTVKSAIDRNQGFVDTIKGKAEYEIVARESTRGQLEDAIPVMEKIIQEHPEIDVVMAVDDPTALGALEVLQAVGRVNDVLLYSVDGSPNAKLMVKSGDMEGTVAQSPITIGKKATEVAYDFLSGEPVEKNVLIPVVLITEENVDKFGTSGWQ